MILRLLPALLMMTIIFVHSAMPAVVSAQESDFISAFLVRLFKMDPETASFVVRKCAHFIEYLILGLCFFFFADGFRLEKGSGFGLYFLKRGLPVWACGTAYALTDEIHQRFVPGRSCELRDLCIDAIGVLTGIGIWMLIKRHRNTVKKTHEISE